MQTLEPKARISLHFGLGKAFNDLAEYGEAMRHYDAANGLRARTMRLDLPALVRLYDDIIRAFPGETLERAGRPEPAPAGACELPVLIVGMPRSGTTLVERIVSAHPAVAAGGELPFWSTRIRNMQIGLGPISDAAALSKAAEDYGAVLRRIDAHALRVTDKAGANFEGLGLIRLAFPDAQIIHCRRHPIDTALSIYFSNFGGHAFANDRGDIVFFYRQYEKLMDFWRSVLRPDRFTEVEYERLVADREMQTRRLIDFLGLSWDEACMTPERNARAVQTASVWQARQPVHETSVERWRRYKSWLGELKELMPRGAASCEAKAPAVQVAKESILKFEAEARGLKKTIPDWNPLIVPACPQCRSMCTAWLSTTEFRCGQCAGQFNKDMKSTTRSFACLRDGATACPVCASTCLVPLAGGTRCNQCGTQHFFNSRGPNIVGGPSRGEYLNAPRQFPWSAGLKGGR